MAAVDVNRGTTNVALPVEVAAEIWQSIQAASAVMRVSPRTELPGSGVEVQVITGDPAASWVEETQEITSDKPTFDTKTMQGYKLGVVVPFSNEFRRDKSKLYAACVSRLPGVLAAKFDNTVFFGKDGAGAAPGSNFDVLAPGAQDLNLKESGTEVYDQFLAAVSAVATANEAANLSEWVLSTQGEVLALGAKDANGRPLFISDLQREGSIGAILGRPAFRSSAVYQTQATGRPETVGFAGDWSYSTWGQVQGVTISISDQATINVGGTQINLWQRDMFAVKATIEAGFRVRDAAEFVQLTDTENGA